jgi:hypothetical protein
LLANGDSEQIVGREPRKRVSHEAFVKSQLALPRGRVNSAVMRFWFSHLTRTICAFAVVLFCTAADSNPNNVLPHRVFDDYGRICWGDEQARLDNFAIRLQMSPEMIGNIIVFDGRHACRGEAIAHAVRAKRYLVEHRHIDPNRVLWRFGGYTDELYTILMDVPRGYPEWQADVITIPLKDVVFVGNCDHRVRPTRCLR